MQLNEVPVPMEIRAEFGVERSFKPDNKRSWRLVKENGRWIVFPGNTYLYEDEMAAIAHIIREDNMGRITLEGQIKKFQDMIDSYSGNPNRSEKIDIEIDRLTRIKRRLEEELSHDNPASR